MCKLRQRVYDNKKTIKHQSQTNLWFIFFTCNITWTIRLSLRARFGAYFRWLAAVHHRLDIDAWLAIDRPTTGGINISPADESKSNKNTPPDVGKHLPCYDGPHTFGLCHLLCNSNEPICNPCWQYYHFIDDHSAIVDLKLQRRMVQANSLNWLRNPAIRKYISSTLTCMMRRINKQSIELLLDLMILSKLTKSAFTLGIFSDWVFILMKHKS